MRELQDLYGMVMVDVLKYTSKEDGLEYYNPIVVYSFGKGEENQVLVPTDIHHVDYKESLKQVMQGLGIMYTYISAEARIFDVKTGDVLETINMNQMMFDSIQEKLVGMMSSQDDDGAEEERILH